ncbi:MAG: ATP synthase F0 subunit B [Desulfosarcinaceae bacterium]|jgi:F-type H+-transporting ATPase subunit b
MVSIDGSVIIQIVNFLVLIFILNVVCYKPIRKILQDRKKKVDGLEGSIDTLSEGAVEKDKAYSDGLRAARAVGQKEKEAMMDAASAEEKALITKITEEAQAELGEIKAKIGSETDTVRAALQKEVDTFAGAITEKILGRTV